MEDVRELQHEADGGIALSKSTSMARWLSLGEFVLGAAIVVGHNIYHRVPNEVPILFVLGLLSLRVRDRNWKAFGLNWPPSWRRRCCPWRGRPARRTPRPRRPPGAS